MVVASQFDGEMFLHDIKEFSEKFALTYDGPPRELPTGLSKFRKEFLEEEVEEYSRATMLPYYEETPEQRTDRLADQLDALVDLVYVALGTAYLHGFNFGEAWRRVHEANMKKVRVEVKEDSKRGSTYDVVKPEGWTPPDLRDLVDVAIQEQLHLEDAERREEQLVARKRDLRTPEEEATYQNDLFTPGPKLDEEITLKTVEGFHEEDYS